MPTETRNKAAPQSGKEGFSIISSEKLLALYRALLRCRALDDRVANLRRSANSTPSNNGWRKLASSPHAAAVAAVIDLLPGDAVVAETADFIPRFVRRAPASAVLATLHSAASHDASPAVLLTRALSAGRIRKEQNKKKIAVVFRSDESESSAMWREALHAAAGERLPILFLCCDPPMVAGANLGTRKYGVPAIAADANDVVALYRVACESIAHARRGNGPTLIECVPWPASLARNGATAPQDAILKMEDYLSQSGISFPHPQTKAAEESARKQRAVAKRSRSLSTRRRALPK